MCAYNVEVDRRIVLGDIARVGKKPMHLEPGDSWYCMMEAYAAWLGSNRWPRLGGHHRALGDCEAARRVLEEMSKGRGSMFVPRPAAPGDPVEGPPPELGLVRPIMVSATEA